jgi:hypothetical protein
MTDEGRKAARALADAVNSCSMQPKQFAEELCHHTHRTLQQQCFVLFAECIKLWAKDRLCGCYDARNDATTALSSRIVQEVGEDLQYIPFV